VVSRERVREKMKRVARSCTALALGIAAGCVAVSDEHSANGLPAARRAEIYERVSLAFTNAILFKPVEGALTNSLAFKLAPLIIQETATGDGETVLRRDRLVGLTDAEGHAAIDKTKPIIYAHEGAVTIHGQPHAQVTFFWRYAAEADAISGLEAAVQGVRITLDADGFPAVWEVLADSSGAALIFVAQSVETTAAREFGSPFPGRRFAVERAAVEQPTVVVARVIEDGPVPMGPIVYVAAESRQISTVICRCMPSQARRLTEESRYYELVSVQYCCSESLCSKASRQTGVKAAVWPYEPVSQCQMEQCLRLPGFF
jgi:hypothetical protein